MKIELKRIPVRDLVEGYEDNDEAGVVGYDGTGADGSEPAGIGETVQLAR